MNLTGTKTQTGKTHAKAIRLQLAVLQELTLEYLADPEGSTVTTADVHEARVLIGQAISNLTNH